MNADPTGTPAVPENLLPPRWVAAGALALCLFLLFGPRPPLTILGQVYRDYLGGGPFAPVAPPAEWDFGPDAPAEIRGGVVRFPPLPGHLLQGTWLGSDAWTGDLRSALVPVPTGGAFLYLPVIGYPALPGNRLTLEILDAAGQVRRRETYAGVNPHESLATWELDLRGQPAGAAVRVELSDHLAGAAGWFGVGRPIFSARGAQGWRTPADENARWDNTLWLFFTAALAATLMFVPGLLLRRWGPAGMRRLLATPAWLPLPGFLALAVFGLALWRTGAGRQPLAGKLWVGATLLGAAALLLEPRRGAATAGVSRVWMVYAALCLLCLQFTALPLTVAGEFLAGTNLRGRMVASPPDNAIPWITGVYFLHGLDGRTRNDNYFGPDWNLGSRGPLMGWVNCALLNVMGIRPADPPIPGDLGWPCDREGNFVGRAAGVVSNAFLLLAGMHLFGRLRRRGMAGDEGGFRFALGWLALCPVMVSNVIFSWPKLLAGAFAALGAAAALDGAGALAIGALLTLAWLSHPVGLLFAPGVALLRAGLAARGAARGAGKMRAWLLAGAALTVATIGCMAPWLWFKWRLGAPDLFLRYPLADGRGPAAALSLASWLHARAQNAWLTFVPGAFHFSSVTTAWFDLPMRGALRVALGYGRTLPGHLGYALFGLAYAAAAWRRLPADAAPGAVEFRRWLLWFTPGLMLVAWGFNDDGLGRACLDPLSVFFVVYAAATAGALWPGLVRWWPALLGALALETAFLLGAGLWWAPDFVTGRLTPARVAQLVGIGLNLLVLWWLALPPQAAPERGQSPGKRA